MAGARKLLATLAVAAFALCVIPASAGAAIYWGNGFTLGAANLDGSSPQFDYFKPEPLGPVCGVALDDGHLYWAGGFSIGRLRMDGSGSAENVVTNLKQPCGVAVNRSNVYWGDPNREFIGRAKPGGGDANYSLITGVSPCGLAIDDTYVYWVDGLSYGIGRARLDGSEVERRFIPPPHLGCGLAVDERSIYWGERGRKSIGRANLDGSEVDSDFIAGTGEVLGIALHGTSIYWTDRGLAIGAVGRARLDGTEVSRSFITSNRPGLFGVAVDSRLTPPPPPMFPSRPVKLGPVRHNRRRGTAVLEIWPPDGGELAVVSPKLGWKVLDHPVVRGSWRVRLKIWAGKSGRVSKRIRRQLRRKGRAPLRLKLSYREEGNFLPSYATRKLALLRTVRTHRKRNAGHRRPDRRRPR